MGTSSIAASLPQVEAHAESVINRTTYRFAPTVAFLR
jgi:hypothetical protein